MAEPHRQRLAVVGMACRFPGGLDSPSKLWEAILGRRSSIGPIPPDRWTTERYYSPEEGAKGKSYIRRGGFLTEDVSLFDAAFFGISPREAENMDPQQRLLLEVVWEAFENAGISLPAMAGRPVGVYVGGFMLDHMITQMAPANRSQINQNTAAGMMMTMLSNRVSHTFDLCGPSLSIDTACSSSLVAFHYACQDVWRGECEMAVVGGANVMLRPEYPMGMCKGHFLSRDGECKSFDERGDGYGRGEGAGAVLIKPLQAAIDAGDPILATVDATGTNQDGRTPGVSMPNGDAQAALIEHVRDSYGVDWSGVRYVECHGTGTAIGDPTEAGAIGRTYGAANRGHHEVVIGSIKSNIGHLEACAGVAGVIKAVLTLQHGVAGPLANLQTPNPKIDCDAWNIRLADEPIPLAEPGKSFSVAVNSFGYGGSNAHAILSRAPVGATPAPVAASESLSHSNGNGHANTEAIPSSHLLPISARSDKALSALCGRYAELLESGADVADVLHSASTKRAQLPHRAVAIGRNRSELITSLEKLSSGESDQHSVRGAEPFTGRRSPVFVFTGMGPQWWGMGQQLYRESKTYREAVTHGDRVFQGVAGFSILEEMLRPEEESRISLTEHAQPANFLIQYGLLDMLREGGLEPGAFIGHSVGEVASAYAAGVLSLEEAMLVSFHRSQLQASTRGAGGMLAIGCSLQDAEESIAPYGGKVSIAAVNGPTNITLAGDVDALADIATSLTQSEVFNRQLDVEVAYHSPTMDPILRPLRDALASLSPSFPESTLYSTVTGALVTERSYDGFYWTQNVRDPVRFADAIRSAIADGFNTFLEVGPHPVLATSLREIFKEAGADARNTHTLRRNHPESENVERAIGQVYCFGCPLDWSRRNPPGRFVRLPNYAWQREHFWMENDRGRQDRIATIDHPMLGIQEAPGAPVWRNDYDHNPVLYLRDHVVDGMPILPAAAYIESILELAALQHSDAAGHSVRRLRIQAPMLIKLERGLDSVTAYDPASRTATVRSLENGKLGAGQVHTTGVLTGLSSAPERRIDLNELQDRFDERLEVGAYYERLARIGLEYGPAFQTIVEIRKSRDASRPAALSKIEIRPEQAHDLALYRLHPTLLDACFQSLLALVDGGGKSFLPTDIAELCVYCEGSPATVYCLAERTAVLPSRIECDLTLMDEHGRVVAAIRGMGLTEAATRPLTDKFGDPIKRQILDYVWRYGAEVGEPKRLGHWLVVEGDPDITAAARQRLVDYGAVVTVSLNPADLDDDSHSSLDGVLTSAGRLDGVLVLNALRPEVAPHDPTGERSVEQLAKLLAAIERLDDGPRPRVYVATRGAFAVQGFDAAVSADQTAINGFARVAFNELEGCRVTTVDLPLEGVTDAIDPLVREVLADDAHDEVAIRAAGRFVSELLESDCLDSDQFDYRPLDDQRPVLVRPIANSDDSVGTARVVDAPAQLPGPEDLRLRVEACVVPKEVLLHPTSNSLSSSLVEVVARVVGAGANVSTFEVGDRVAGWVAPDVASHLVVDHAQSVLVLVPEDADAIDLAATMTLAARMEAAAAELRLEPGDAALVDSGPEGDAFSEALERRGVRVVRLVVDPVEGSDQYERSTEGIHEAVQQHTAGNGFQALAVHVAGWSSEFDTRSLCDGGALVDLSDESLPVAMPDNVGSLVRTDLPTLKARRLLASALESVVVGVRSGAVRTQACLDVSLADMAWQKLPLADTQSTLVLTFETGSDDLPVVRRHDLRFRPDATYLVTGGFGGLGRKTVDWLVENGAAHVVITGRTAADTPERAAYLEELASRGVEVRAIACDTSNAERVREVVAQIERELPPLRGVFHSGAVIEDQPINEIQTDALRRVMRSKAAGAWNLHSATEHCELDHFVMYSSVANLVGNSRQSVYSAANGYLNGLAHQRRLQGKPGLSVCWGAIADVGVVARDEKLEQFLRYTGLRGIESAEGLEVLREAMARGVTQFGVTMITSWADWARFETRGAKSPRFASLIEADSAGQDSSARDALVEELESLSKPDQIELLASLIVEVLAEVLKSDPSAISIDCAISQLGIDSLMATDIQMMLDSKLGLNVPVLQLIGETTTREVAVGALGNLLGNPSVEPTLAPA